MSSLSARVPMVLVVSGLLVLAGCGGTSGPTRSQYIASADAICQTARTQTTPQIQQVASSAVALSAGGASRAPQLAAAVRRLHTLAVGYLAQLEGLKQPSGDHAAIERFLTPLARVVAVIGQAATALESGKAPDALAFLQQAQPEAQQVNSAAQAYGLKQCGTVFSALG